MQEMTASEPLTESEEYEMQIEWEKDEKSEFISACLLLSMDQITVFPLPSECTFIILEKELFALDPDRSHDVGVSKLKF